MAHPADFLLLFRFFGASGDPTMFSRAALSLSQRLRAPARTQASAIRPSTLFVPSTSAVWPSRALCTAATRPFRTLGLQQVAVLSSWLWHDCASAGIHKQIRTL